MPVRSSSLRNSDNGTTSSNRPTDATYFLHITKDLFDEELKKRNSYYKSASEAKANIPKQAEGEIAKFTSVIKSYARMSKNDLYTIADRYHVPHSDAESIARKNRVKVAE